MMSVKLSDKYIQGFPQYRLLSINNKPTYRTVRSACKCLSANASIFKNLLRGSQHGYLALKIPPAHYTNLSHTAFVVPTNPWLTPMYPSRATLAAITALKAHHNEQICMKDPTTDFHNGMLLQMLEYLYYNYGKINEENKNNNIEHMKEPYDVTNPIELFFQQIQY